MVSLFLYKSWTVFGFSFVCVEFITAVSFGYRLSLVVISILLNVVFWLGVVGMLLFCGWILLIFLKNLFTNRLTTRIVTTVKAAPPTPIIT